MHHHRERSFSQRVYLSGVASDVMNQHRHAHDMMILRRESGLVSVGDGAHRPCLLVHNPLSSLEKLHLNYS